MQVFIAKIYCPIENDWEMVGVYSSKEIAERAALWAIKKSGVLMNVRRPFVVWEYPVNKEVEEEKTGMIGSIDKKLAGEIESLIRGDKDN